MPLLDATGNPITKKTTSIASNDHITINVALEEDEKYLIELLGKASGKLYELFHDYQEGYVLAEPDHNVKQITDHQNTANMASRTILECLLAMKTLVLNYKKYVVLCSGLKEVTIFDKDENRYRIVKVENIEFHFPDFQGLPLTEQEEEVYREQIIRDAEDDKIKAEEAARKNPPKENVFQNRVAFEESVRLSQGIKEDRTLYSGVKEQLQQQTQELLSLGMKEDGTF